MPNKHPMEGIITDGLDTSAPDPNSTPNPHLKKGKEFSKQPSAEILNPSQDLSEKEEVPLQKVVDHEGPNVRH